MNTASGKYDQAGRVGGIVGMAYSTTVEFCSNEGAINVLGNINYAGGIAGTVGFGTTVRYCSNTADIALDNLTNANASESAFGGIVGFISPYGTGNPVKGNAASKDWIGIQPKDDTGYSIYWYYLTNENMMQPVDLKTGQTSTRTDPNDYNLPAGNYIVYFVPSNGYATSKTEWVEITISKKSEASALEAPVSATYEGYSNATSINATLAGYPVWYSPSRMPVASTWWHQVITGMDWELCVNNSYSGGRVTHPLTYQTRAANLHSANGVTPDVIIVYYGINDYNNMVSLAEFTSAYDQMLKKMVETYPDARIYCCTLNPIICTDNGRNTSLEKNGAGVMLSTFNNAIIRIAGNNGADFIDLYSAIGSMLYLKTYDRIHPTKDGMLLMSESILQKLRADFATE